MLRGSRKRNVKLLANPGAVRLSKTNTITKFLDSLFMYNERVKPEQLNAC